MKVFPLESFAIYSITRLGYRLFSYNIEEQKRTCKYLSKEGLLVLLHSSPLVFCKSSTIVGLHQLARGLMTATVTILFYCWDMV